ncbi:hypothetical protein FRUB_01753 [Fimbriiglobus ruber]|uniref:Uncharacterized protein n=1 Tax=Fimbriiglobus ruber TaxID=1908690 RepID=A0A225DVM1_9BACT|nr:DUF935 family protein [Fimbriiglobus ruber]OWK45422.1 hypothetical protein FRUB_01753 [Fimbriiglobus ruber]
MKLWDGGTLLAMLRRPHLRQRFILHAHKREAADYWQPEMAGRSHGVGLRDYVYWAWWLRDEMLSWLTDYMEKVGSMGLLLFYYEDGNPAAEAAAKQAAADARGKSALAVPVPRGRDKDAAKVEVIAAQTAGAQFLVDMVDRYFERHIERLYVGQSLSAGTEGSGLGGEGVAALHADTKFNLLAWDADNLGETLTRDLVGVLQHLNFRGVRWRYRWAFRLPDPDARDKLDALVKAANLPGAKLTFQADEVRALVGLTKPGPGDEVVGGDGPAARGAPLGYAQDSPHAPRGGIDLKGKHFPGGQFIPHGSGVTVPVAADLPAGASETKILVYSAQPGSGGRKWNILLVDKQGASTRVSEGNFPTEEAVKKFVDAYLAANDDDGTKIVPLKLHQCDVDKAVAAAHAEHARQQRAAQEQAARKAKADAEKAEAERIAAAQKQAADDIKKKEAEKKLWVRPRQEMMPDGSVRPVTIQQHDGVRAGLDKPGGLGGKVLIIENGQIADPESNTLALRPTKQEIDQAVKTRFLELLGEQERAKPEYMLGKLQMALDIAGLIPVVGIPFNATSAGISIYRGDVLGASLSLLAMLPLAGDAAGSAKIAKTGFTAANDAARTAKTAERTAELLKYADDAAKIAKAQDEARILVAASLETGYLQATQVKQALMNAGRTADEADVIIKEAIELGAKGGKEYELAKVYTSKIRAGLFDTWATITPEAKQLATDWEATFLKKLKEGGGSTEI